MRQPYLHGASRRPRRRNRRKHRLVRRVRHCADRRRKLFPLCTLTFDVAWGSAEGSGYTKAGYIKTIRADNVKKYLNYVVKEGQGIGKWYEALPTGVPSKATNIKAAAEAAVGKIK